MSRGGAWGQVACAVAVVVGLSAGCIASSVVEPEQRAPNLADPNLEWGAAQPARFAGTYLSSELTGPLASSLRLLVYRFDAGGSYTGAALLDGDPPHFEVLTGTWRLDTEQLWLDDAPPASIEMAPDGSLRLSGAEGRVVLRRERDR